MPVSDSFRLFALEQLERVLPAGLRSRSMFGGVGLYAGERFFALLADDALYLKADALSRAEFEAAGMSPFVPFQEGRAMNYYEVSAELLENPETLTPWVERALGAAERQARKRRPVSPQEHDAEE